MSQEPLIASRKSNKPRKLLELANANSSYIFLNSVVNKWNQALNHDIPALAKSASPDIDKIWGSFLTGLKIGTEDFGYGILEDLQSEIPALEAIKDGIKSQVFRALKNISRGATNIHPDLVNVVQKEWEPAFRKALEPKGRSSEICLNLL